MIIIEIRDRKKNKLFFILKDYYYKYKYKYKYNINRNINIKKIILTFVYLICLKINA